jgi:hypothetical protein
MPKDSLPVEADRKLGTPAPASNYSDPRDRKTEIHRLSLVRCDRKAAVDENWLIPAEQSRFVLTKYSYLISQSIRRARARERERERERERLEARHDH